MYLSPAWFEEVSAAARRSERLRPTAAGARVTIQQVVTGGPDGEVRYWVRLEDGAVEAGPGDAAERADATVTESYETAAAVSRGELEVEAALLAGRIRLSGDVGVLLRNQAALQAVGAAFAEVRDRTTYG